MKTTEVKSFPAMGLKKRHLILIIGIIIAIILQSCYTIEKDQPAQTKENQNISCYAGFGSVS